ncbi:WhiB family transcriptional regulator [Streptomyces sp. NPDC060001]|uniref:WhiB family transcriptional regulator n=1 Tax=Streptomyces sp. NPDC060001 TaxID=3347032 RepID=UPI0036886FB8
MSYTGQTPDTEPAGQWVKHAACRQEGIDPDTFHPDNNAQLIEEARAICRPCPVRRDCLIACMRQEGGKSSVSRWGVYAGLTPRQREQLYHRLRHSGRKP